MLQKDLNDLIRALIFNDIIKRINYLTDSEPYQNNKRELENWYERLFNTFEWTMYCLNHQYLPSHTSAFIDTFILGYFERIKKECPNLVKSWNNRIDIDAKKGKHHLFFYLRKWLGKDNTLLRKLPPHL